MQKIENMKYIGWSIPLNCTDEKKAEEWLLDQIILESEIPISEEKIEQELQMEVAGFMQNRRYRAMAGDYQLEEINLEEWKDEIRKEIIRDYQIAVILETVIEKEKLEVSHKELEREAKIIAEREHTTVEMVQRFLGDDYALLKKEVLYNKAKKFLVQIAKQ